MAADAARRAVSGAVRPIDEARYLLQLVAIQLMECWLAGSPGDIDEVIRTAHRAVESALADHPDRAAMLVNLAAAYETRYDLQGQPIYLDIAIDVGHKALDAVPDHDRDRAPASANLSRAYLLRGTPTDSPEDVRAAVAHAETAVRLTERGQPVRARRLADLGDARYAWFRHTGRANDLAAAESAWRHAIQDDTAPATPRLAAALSLARALTDGGTTDWCQAVAAFADAVRLLPLLAWPGLLRADQEHQLIGWPAVAVDAGACAVRASDPGRAVELLDHGRSVIWGHHLRFRADLHSLSIVHPGLASRMDEVRRRLEIDPARTLVSR